MPFDKFETVDTPEKLVDFFKQTFPDSIPLMGEKELVRCYFENPRGSLQSIKVFPFSATLKNISANHTITHIALSFSVMRPMRWFPFMAKE